MCGLPVHCAPYEVNSSQNSVPFYELCRRVCEPHLSYVHTEGVHSFILSLVFSLEGRAWQEPEPSQVTGMALAHCILGKFLGVVCHCFPPPLDIPTLSARCLRPQRRERWNCGRERCPVVIFPEFRLPRKFRDLLHAANLRHGTDGFTSSPKEGVLRIFSP